MSDKSEHLHFTVKGEFVTRMSRTFWNEGSYWKAFDLLFCMEGMTMGIACDIIAGKSKLAGDSNPPDYTWLEPDNDNPKSWQDVTMVSAIALASKKEELKEIMYQVSMMCDFTHLEGVPAGIILRKAYDLQMIIDSQDKLKTMVKKVIDDVAYKMAIHKKLRGLPDVMDGDAMEVNENMFKVNKKDTREALIEILTDGFGRLSYWVESGFISSAKDLFDLNDADIKKYGNITNKAQERRDKRDEWRKNITEIKVEEYEDQNKIKKIKNLISIDPQKALTDALNSRAARDLLNLDEYAEFDKDEEDV